jgi:hypothetical protein
VWGAVRANKTLVLIIVVIFTGAGIAAGVMRHPKYSATANAGVMHINFGSTGALAAFQSAVPVLADTYARSINADGVVRPLAAKFHTSVKTILKELTATAVPASPLFMVTAKTPSATGSLALANAAMAQLVSYLHGVNTGNSDARSLYTQLKKAESTLAAAQNNEVAVKANIEKAMTINHAVAMSAAQQAKMAAAQSAVSTAADQVTGLRSTYDQSVLSGSDTQYVQQLTSATKAVSDRSSRLELFAFIGLAFGIAVATAAAVLRQGRALRKPRTA